MKLINNYEIPSIGYGTFPHKDILIDCVPFAIRNGYKLIDTSDNYHNEEFVGRGLSCVDLSKLVVVSKFSQPFRTHELEKCFEESKNKLGSLNIYLLHWPYPYLWKKQWRKMEELYLSGKCDAIGVCNFDVGFMMDLLSFCRVKPLINQIERHPLFQQQAVVDFCHNHGIAVMAYSPVARMDKTLHKSPVLMNLSEKYDKSISQIILRWDLDTGCIPIPASSSEKHILDNIGILDFSLNRQDIAEINKLEQGKRIRFNPHTRFSWKKKVKFALYYIKLAIVNK